MDKNNTSSFVPGSGFSKQNKYFFCCTVEVSGESAANALIRTYHQGNAKVVAGAQSVLTLSPLSTFPIQVYVSFAFLLKNKIGYTLQKPKKAPGSCAGRTAEGDCIRMTYQKSLKFTPSK